MISAGAGLDASLEEIRKDFLRGYATKGDYEKALRVLTKILYEMKRVIRGRLQLHFMAKADDAPKYSFIGTVIMVECSWL